MRIGRVCLMIVFLIGASIASVAAQPFDYEWGTPLEQLFQNPSEEDQWYLIGDNSWEKFEEAESRAALLRHRGPWAYEFANVHQFLGKNTLVFLTGNKRDGLLSVQIQIIDAERRRFAPLPVGIEGQYERKYGLPARESVSNDGRMLTVWEDENGTRISVYGPSLTAGKHGYITYESRRKLEIDRERNAGQDADL